MNSQSLPTISRERLVHLALFVLSIAFLVLWNALDAHTTAMQMVPAFALFGAGLGLTLPRLYRSVSFLSGAVVGLLFIGAMFVSSMSTQLTSGVEQSKSIPEAYKTQFLHVLSAQTWDIVLGAAPEGGKTWPESLSIEIAKISHQAKVSTAKNAVAVGSLISALWLLVSLVILPEKKKPITEPGLLSELYTELIAIDLELTTASN